MLRWLSVFMAIILVGCGPSFSPTLFTQIDDMMLPPSQGLNGPNPPQVGGLPNKSGDGHWHGKILLVSTPLSPMQHARVHPAMKSLDSNLQAGGDEEVSTVGFVLQRSIPIRGGGGRGLMTVTLIDWKSKVNLGTLLIKEWTDHAPEAPEFEKAYPTLAGEVKKLHK